jgi:hypothetical protein
MMFEACRCIRKQRKTAQSQSVAQQLVESRNRSLLRLEISKLPHEDDMCNSSGISNNTYFLKIWQSVGHDTHTMCAHS